MRLCPRPEPGITGTVPFSAKPVRIIPRLDIKGPNLVKGIHLEGLRVLGNPIDFARYYYEAGADELIYVDVVASLYQRNSLPDLLRKTSSSVFIPITVGGGLRTLEDLSVVLKAGADKVCINTAAVNNPAFIAEAVKVFGSSTIVVAIEVIRQDDGAFMVYTENGRETTGVEAVSWASRVEELGAGEILLTSINCEGVGSGYDVDLIRRVAAAVSIPVIAHGGGGKAEHVAELLTVSGAEAVAVASMFHYGCMGSMGEFAPKEGNLDFLKSGRRFSKISETTIKDLKSFLAARGIACRIAG